MAASPWHAAYREEVLLPDYHFASQQLASHLLDAMLAHVKTVARLPDAHQGESTALRAKPQRPRHDGL